MTDEQPDWTSADEAFQALMAEHTSGDFARVPVAEINRFADERGILRHEALKRYGWWSETGQIYLTDSDWAEVTQLDD